MAYWFKHRYYPSSPPSHIWAILNTTYNLCHREAGIRSLFQMQCLLFTHQKMETTHSKQIQQANNLVLSNVTNVWRQDSFTDSGESRNKWLASLTVQCHPLVGKDTSCSAAHAPWEWCQLRTMEASWPQLCSARSIRVPDSQLPLRSEPDHRQESLIDIVTGRVFCC